MIYIILTVLLHIKLNFWHLIINLSFFFFAIIIIMVNMPTRGTERFVNNILARLKSLLFLREPWTLDIILVAIGVHVHWPSFFKRTPGKSSHSCNGNSIASMPESSSTVNLSSFTGFVAPLPGGLMTSISLISSRSSPVSPLASWFKKRYN